MFNKSSRMKSAVVLVAVIVGVATWSVIRVLGVEPMVGKGSDPHPVGALDVAAATLVAGLAAWGVYAWLARRHLAGVWPFVGSTALAISIIGPSWFADGASAVSLICLHLAVALVLVMGFTLTTTVQSYRTDP
jgi:Family of unknown function (DUF6069)